MQTFGPTLVIHGGAGTIDKNKFPEEKRKEYRDALKKSLKAGYEILAKGGSSMDAAEASVRVMEGLSDI